MSHLGQLHRDVVEAHKTAHDLAERIGHADPDKFAAEMVHAWLKGRVDRWILHPSNEVIGDFGNVPPFLRKADADEDDACECGALMSEHVGGWVLLHHDEVVQATRATAGAKA